VNGVQVAWAKLGPGVSADLNTASSLKFGRRGDDRGFFLNGRLDEIELVVGRALSDAELSRIYLAGAAGDCKR